MKQTFSKKELMNLLSLPNSSFYRYVLEGKIGKQGSGLNAKFFVADLAWCIDLVRRAERNAMPRQSKAHNVSVQNVESGPEPLIFSEEELQAAFPKWEELPKVHRELIRRGVYNADNHKTWESLVNATMPNLFAEKKAKATLQDYKDIMEDLLNPAGVHHPSCECVECAEEVEILTRPESEIARIEELREAYYGTEQKG